MLRARDEVTAMKPPCEVVRAFCDTDAKRNDAMTLFSYILLRCDGSLGVRKGSTQNV